MANPQTKPDPMPQPDPMAFARPGPEHDWLEKFVGTWEFEGHCFMGPEEPQAAFSGTESVRSLGGLWIVAEGEGTIPGSSELARSIMTIGYDARQERYVAAFVASMMTHLWHYTGSVDTASDTLTLETEGPAFSGDGTALFRDVHALKGNNRTLTSSVRGEDGQWMEFMVARYQRT